ncbi:MAG: hypothetical protein R3C19_20055 [Planctomycetaceae bacterium]
MRLEALAALADWKHPSPLDRVTGRYRDPAAIERHLDPGPLAAVLSGLIRDAHSEISAAALATAVALDFKVNEDALADLVMARIQRRTCESRL